MGALLLGLAAAVLAAPAADPAPPLAGAPVRLAPVPARVVASCRSIQARARVPLLCPTLLPRATAGNIPSVQPAALSVTPYGDGFRRRIAGVDIAYGAPWEGPGWTAHRWRNRPCSFLHFDLFRRAPDPRAVPPGARPATIGGRRGLLAAAHEGGYYGGVYFANHVRFLWREHGVNWVATLHTFGEAPTERLLGRLVAGLRPVDSIPSPRRRGTAAGVTPNAIAVGAGSVWVAALGDGSRNFRGTVYRLDGTGGVTARLHPGRGPHALAFAGGSLWVASFDGIARIDPRTGRKLAFVKSGHWQRALAVGGGLLWVANAQPFGGRGSVVAIDPRTNRLTGFPVRVGRAPTAVAAGRRGALWVADELDGTVTRVERRRVVARIRVGHMPTAVAVGEGAVWVANTGDGTVSRVDPATNTVAATLRAGPAPRGLAAGLGAVWVASAGDGTLRRIDPATNRVTVVRGGLVDPLALAVAGSTLWAATNEGVVERIRP